MAELKHWTERSVDDFLYKIGWDFVAQIEHLIESGQTSQAALAESLGVSKGRVSQVLSNPGNLTLKNIVRYARALGKKVSVVAYDDADPDNQRGPINAEIFSACWERAGKPTDYFALNDASYGFVGSEELEESSASTGGSIIGWRNKDETAFNDGVMKV
jgi:predicted XRE-type DNA-binding protein